MLKFDSNKILNSASKLDKGKKTLQNAKNNLKNFDIPNDFRYGSELKKCIDNIQNMAKYTEDLSKWMQKKVGLFNNTQKKMIKSVANLNDTFDLKLIGTNIYPHNSQTTSEDEAEASALRDFDFANRFIDWEQLSKIKANGNEETEDFDIIKKILELLGLDGLQYLFETEYEKKKRICEMLYEFYAINIETYLIDNIEGDRGLGIIITLEDGTEIKITGENTGWYDQGVRVIITSSDGSQTLYIMSNGDIYSNIGLTNKITDITGQYGGNQMDFKYKNAELVADPKIQEIIRQYWPDATEEDIELLLYKFASIGCGCVAAVNTIFEEYAGHEEEFERTFGFPMYVEDEKGARDYNYEYLIMEYFCYVWGDRGYTIQELYGDISYETAEDGSVSRKTDEGTGKAHGLTSIMEVSFFRHFLKDKYGIDCDVVDIYYIYPEEWEEFETERVKYSSEQPRPEQITEEIRKLLEQGKKVQITASGSELYSVYETYDGKEIRGYLSDRDVGGHSMYVTGITDEGEIIVSSWGKKYIIDISDLNWLRITIFDY